MTSEINPDDCRFLGEFSGGEMWIRPAFFEQDHPAIASVAQQSKIAAVFLRPSFPSEEAYAEQRVRVLVDRSLDSVQRCVGFSVAKTKAEETALYFLAVDKRERRKGCGTELLFDLRDRCGSHRISSTLPKSAKSALAFSRALGFYEHGRTARGGVRLRFDVA